MKPSTLRWGIALVLLVGLQLAAYGWGEAVTIVPRPDFLFDRPARTAVQWSALVVFFGGSLGCVAKLLPERFLADRFSLPGLVGAAAALLLLASSVLGARGLVDGVNALMPREPDERRTGVVAGYTGTSGAFAIAVLRLGERHTLEVALRQDFAKTLPPDTPVDVELHHGVLFTWGRVHRLGPPANPSLPWRLRPTPEPRREVPRGDPAG